MMRLLRASDVYMDMLETLPNEEKLDLISKLVKSMKKGCRRKEETERHLRPLLHRQGS